MCEGIEIGARPRSRQTPDDRCPAAAESRGPQQAAAPAALGSGPLGGGPPRARVGSCFRVCSVSKEHQGHQY